MLCYLAIGSPAGCFTWWCLAVLTCKLGTKESSLALYHDVELARDIAVTSPSAAELGAA